MKHWKEKIKNIENENIVFMNTIFMLNGEFVRRNENPKFKIFTWLFVLLLSPAWLIYFILVFLFGSIFKGFKHSYKRTAKSIICLYLGVSNKVTIEKVKL